MTTLATATVEIDLGTLLGLERILEKHVVDGGLEGKMEEMLAELVTQAIRQVMDNPAPDSHVMAWKMRNLSYELAGRAPHEMDEELIRWTAVVTEDMARLTGVVQQRQPEVVAS